MKYRTISLILGICFMVAMTEISSAAPSSKKGPSHSDEQKSVELGMIEIGRAHV